MSQYLAQGRVATPVLIALLSCLVLAAKPTLPVAVSHAKTTPYAPHLEALARARSPQTITMSAPYTAVYGKPATREGALVKKGARVLRLIPVSADQAVQAARLANHAAAQKLANTRVLARGGLATPAELAAAKATAAQTASRLRQLATRRDAGDIQAPFAGTVSYLDAAGTRIDAGTPVVRFQGAGERYIEARVPLDAASWLRPGIQARLSARHQRWPAVVYAVSDRADHAGLLTVYLHSSAALVPGESAHVRFTGRAVPAIAIPRQALVMGKGGTALFIDDSGVAREVPVTVVHATRALAFVTGAIPDGTLVITAPVERLRPGVRVTWQIDTP